MYGNKTLYTYLVEFVQQEPDKKILGWYGGWLTNTELLERVESCAWELKHRGVKRGDYVAVRTSRSPEAVIAILGLQVLGAVAVLTDAHNKVRDFLRDSGVDIPVTHFLTNEDTARGLWDGKNMMLTNCKTGETTPLDPLNLPSKACPEVDGDGKAPSFVIFTSGSTGKKKAAIQSQTAFTSARIGSIPRNLYTKGDIVLGFLPMDHIFGLVTLAGIFIQRHAMYLSKETDLNSLMKDIQDVGITRINGTPQLFLAMCAMKDQYDVSSLRAGLIGSAPFTYEQFCKIEEELDMLLLPVYGMSEVVAITSGSIHDPREIRGNNNGPFYEMNTGKILLDDGTEAEPGQVGEICVAGPCCLLGYYGDPTPTTGMFHTGDLGYVNERGYLFITGRKKDIIIRNGNNLSPRRIEEAILTVPGVKEACVMGIPSEACGEVPCAMVIGSADEETIMEHIRMVLAKNELPEGIMLVDAMPLLGSGKPDKQKARDLMIAWRNA